MNIKLSFGKLKVLVNLTLVIFIAVFCVACDFKGVEKPSKYLVDIEVVNKTDSKIDYLELYEKENESAYLITKAHESQNGPVHFAISYNKDSNFYIKGSVDQQEIKKYDFNLHGFEQVHQKQTLYIYLTRNTGGELELHK